MHKLSDAQKLFKEQLERYITCQLLVNKWFWRSIGSCTQGTKLPTTMAHSRIKFVRILFCKTRTTKETVQKHLLHNLQLDMTDDVNKKSCTRNTKLLSNQCMDLFSQGMISEQAGPRGPPPWCLPWPDMLFGELFRRLCYEPSSSAGSRWLSIQKRIEL